MTKKIALKCGLAASFISTMSFAASAPNPVGSQREPITTFSKHWQVPIPAFNGQTVRVWRDTNNRYVIEPYLIADWQKFESDVGEKCSADLERVTVRLLVQMDSLSVVNAAAGYLKSNNLASIDPSEISAYPFLTMTFYTGGADANDNLSREARHRLPLGVDDAASTDNLSINYSFLGTIPVPLTDSCTNLKLISEGHDLQASMFAPFNSVKSNSMRIVLRDFRRQDAIRDLLESQTLEGEKKLLWSSKSRKKGINFGPIGYGSTSTSGGITPMDTRRRIVSSSLLAETVEEASRSIHGQYVTQLSTASIDATTIYNSLMRLVEDRSKASTLFFEKQADNKWKLYTEHEQWLLDQPAVQELIQAKIDSDTSSQRDTEASRGDAKASEKLGSTFKVLQDVQWKTEGATPLPVSARIRYVDETTFSYEDVASWEEAQVREEQGLQTIPITAIDAQSNAYSNGFRDGFKKATLIRRPPKRIAVIHPHWMQPDYSRPAPFIPPMACDKPEEAVEKAKPLQETAYKHLTGRFPNAAAFDQALVAAHTDYASKLGCTQLQSPFQFNDPAFRGKTLMIWNLACFINAEWSTWYAGRMFEVGREPNSGTPCFTQIPELVLLEPPPDWIKPISASELEGVKVASPPTNLMPHPFNYTKE